MGKFISKQGIQNFGEAFLSTMARERKLKQEQEQFNQQMSFRSRQLKFLNNYREGLLADQDAQEKRLREQFEFNKEQALKPITPKPKTETSLENLYGGKVEVKRETDPTTGESRIIDYGSFFSPPKEGGGGGGKEPKLSDASSKGLAWLKNPIFEKEAKTGDKIQSWDIRPEEIANKFSESVNSLKKDLLDSRTSSWFDTIVSKWGRIPTGLELAREISKHAGSGTLTDTDVGKLRRFAEYLKGVDSGMDKIQRNLGTIK